MTETAVATVGEVLPAEEPRPFQLMMQLEAEGCFVRDNSGYPVGLHLSASTTLPQWIAVGRMFGVVSRSWDFMLGDFLNFGVDAFGEEAEQEGVEDTPSERYNEALRVTGLRKERLLRISGVCARVAASRRRSVLSFTHHEIVQMLPPAEQEKWLTTAAEHGWTTAEMKRAIDGVDDGQGALDDGDPAGPLGDGLSASERLEKAARLVWNTGAARPSDGFAAVPLESWSQLGAALGEGN